MQITKEKVESLPLFALLKERRYRWIIIPALIGCSTLIADGFITPAISISSAVEGVNNIYPDMPVIPIIVGIIILLFAVQQFGTAAIWKVFWSFHGYMVFFPWISWSCSNY